MRGLVTALMLSCALAACAAPRRPAPEPAPMAEPVCPRDGAPLSCAGSEAMGPSRDP